MSLVKQLKECALPNGVLPLACERHPFTRLTDETISTLLNLVESQPERQGRLTDAARQILGISCSRPTTGHVIEVHLDCTAVPPDFENFLVVHGFEPDHFHRFVPDCYPDHYTLKFIVPRIGDERGSLVRFTHATEDAVIEEMKRRGDVTGYIEHEVYNLSNCRRVVPFVVPTAEEVAQFPFGAGALVVRDVSCVHAEQGKAADIHIKTPLPVRGPAFAGANSLTMQMLRQRLLGMGFYEVVTEAGNMVYTAQFIRSVEAFVVYRCLADYFETAGGIVDITVEPCVRFWRMGSVDEWFAPVPPLVTLR